MKNKPLTMIVYGFCMIWRIRQMEEGVCANLWVVIQKCIPTVNSIASAMDNRDTIDHHILLNKLCHYGIRGLLVGSLAIWQTGSSLFSLL